MSDKAFIYYSPEANEFFIIEDSNGFINYESDFNGNPNEKLIRFWLAEDWFYIGEL